MIDRITVDKILDAANIVDVVSDFYGDFEFDLDDSED